MARKYFAVPREAFSFWDDCRKETVSTPAVSMTFLKKKNASPLRFLHRCTDTIVLSARGNL
jgi:hypothetical protein